MITLTAAVDTFFEYNYAISIRTTFLGESFDAEDARALGKRLIEMADWLESQKGKRG